MEKAPDIYYSDDPQQSEYSDRPPPGRGFLLLFNVVIIGSILPLLFRAFDDGLNDPEIITAVALGVPIIALVYWLVRKGAHGTSYRISENTLELRGGLIYKKIRIGQILEISHARSHKELVNPFLRRQGFCNRFTNLVRLDIKGDTVFISPSDPEQFIEMLRSLKENSANAESTPMEHSR
jgi:hypothetical protein